MVEALFEIGRNRAQWAYASSPSKEEGRGVSIFLERTPAIGRNCGPFCIMGSMMGPGGKNAQKKKRKNGSSRGKRKLLRLLLWGVGVGNNGEKKVQKKR